MNVHENVYPASLIKRHRATESEMEERAEFLIAYASQHAPVTVRQLYYQAEVAGLPGIEKTEAGYAKIQHQVLELRRQGLLSYRLIADSTRQQRRPYTSNNMADALENAVYGDAPGRAAANRLAERASAAGWRVRIMRCPEGVDWNDVENEAVA